jgi:hypothetical protein
MKPTLRSLKSYKSQNYAKAREMGVLEELILAQTLTAARRILFGGGKVRKKGKK